MVETLQVQHTMHDQVSEMSFCRLILLHGFPPDHGEAKYQIAGQQGYGRVAERKYIGRIVFTTIVAIEILAFGFIDEAHDNFCGMIA
jgi:hypothetical protein